MRLFSIILANSASIFKGEILFHMSYKAFSLFIHPVFQFLDMIKGTRLRDEPRIKLAKNKKT
jgi:hypothetical protein